MGETHRLRRDDWMDLARNLDWELSYKTEQEVFPEQVAGRPWLRDEQWRQWDEPYKTTYDEYVRIQHQKETEVRAVLDLMSRPSEVAALDPAWINAMKLHGALLPLAEFAATVGNLRAGRFGRHSAWRTMSTLGALDEARHAQIPLRTLQPLIAVSPQFDWVHRFYHENSWVALAARHLFDELLLCADPIEFAIGTHFVFETGFTNLQFIGLSAVCDQVRDRLFESMLSSIQTDEARHAQIGYAVLQCVAREDREYAQYLADKWFWRSWIVFAITTGFTMDYLAPVGTRKSSFKEFVQEWVVDQYLATLERVGLERPFYWSTFEQSIEHYHHMVYASAYTYRGTVWFDMVVPGPQERAWLREKYPESWPAFEPIWRSIGERWKAVGPELELAVHGTAIVGFCDLCQVVLCGGTPERNTAVVQDTAQGRKIFCSEPCRWIYQREPERYGAFQGLVARVLTGKAPANLVELLTQYCNLDYDHWGKDAHGGRYDWLKDEEC